MDFKELGHFLRTEREKQGLSISDVHERIKIGPSSVEAIEAGDHENLPHMVYYKGFVRNYAVLLGLDPAECLKAFEESDDLSLEESADQSDTTLESEAISEEFADGGGRKKRHWLSMVITLCLLILLGWLLSKLFLSAPSVPTEERGPVPDSGQEEMLQPETGVQPPEVPDNENQPVISESEQVPQAGSTEPPGQDIEPRSEAESEPLNTAETQPDSASETEAADLEASAEGTQVSETQEEEPPAAPPDRQTLQISASEACWLSASMDDRERDIYLRPGESITLHFEEELAVKLGNAGGVSLVYNGEPYALQADSGEVLTLTLP